MALNVAMSFFNIPIDGNMANYFVRMSTTRTTVRVLNFILSHLLTLKIGRTLRCASTEYEPTSFRLVALNFV
jgi:hypothetical protein